MSFYRIQQADRDVTALLDPANWESRQWEGELLIDCRDCDGSDCALCDGSGQVEDVRNGVSVCGSVEDLVAYFRIHEADLSDVVLVELKGRYAQDRDHDFNDGALLIHPTEIVSVTPVDVEFIDAVYPEYA